MAAAPLAFAMEFGKLFVPGKHPDPTDVPIAMFAAAAAFRLARQFHQWALQDEPAPPIALEASPIAGAQASAPTNAAGVLSSLLLLGGVGIALLYYPLGGLWLYDYRIMLLLCVMGVQASLIVFRGRHWDAKADFRRYFRNQIELHRSISIDFLDRDAGPLVRRIWEKHS